MLAAAAVVLAVPTLAGAATVGTGACAQTVDNTTGVSVTQTGGNCVVTFGYAARAIAWTVPANVTSMSFTIKGAQGGGLGGVSSTGRPGAVFGGTLQNLGANPVLYVTVGDSYSAPNNMPYGGFGDSVGGDGGYNGATGGGGSTGVRLNGTGLSARILVAGGGGGEGLSGPAGGNANGSTGGVHGYTDSGCSWTYFSGYAAAAGGRGGNTNARNAGGGGGGYAGGGPGGYTNGASPNECSANNGGFGGSGSSYADGTHVAIGSPYASAANWTSTTSGTNLVYTSALYSNSSGDGQAVFTFPAASITVTTQPSTTGTSGTALATQPAVTVDNGSGPVSGVTVTASIASSPGSQVAGMPTLGGTVTATTNGSGVATFAGLAITGKAGAYTLQFAATGYPSATSNTVTLSASSTPDAAQSTITAGAATLTAANPSPTTSITVQARDAGGNSLTAGGATVALSASGGSIGTVTDNGNGAYAAMLTAPQTAGLVAITGTINGVAIGTNGSVTILPAAAAALAVGTQPAAGAAYSGQALGTQPTVRIVDAFGNTVTSASDAITATLVTVSGTTGSLSGTTIRSAVSGVATYTNLAVTGTASSSYRLRFGAGALPAVESAAFALARAPQTVSFPAPSSPKTYGDSPVQISASTTASGLLISWSGTPGVCSVTGDTTLTAGATKASVAFIGAGTCTITASQAGDADFAPATPVPRTITVDKAAQPTLTISSPVAATYGSTIALATTGGAGTGAVTYALTTPGVCTLTSGVLSFSAPGSCVVQATKATDANYLVKTSVLTTITVSRASQTIAFTSTVLANPLPNGTYTVTATASSGLTVGLALLQGAGTACSLSGATAPATITFLAAGTCEVIATQAGNGNYLAAAVEPTQVIAVGSLNQSITFAQPSDVGYGSAPFVLAATASSALAPTFTSSTPSVCTATSGGLITPVAVGTCTITASQVGNAQYAAASPVPRSFAINAVVATAPYISSASAGDGRITLGITAPGFAGGVAVSGYRLVAMPSSGPAITSDACVDVTAPIVCAIDGLANGTAYTITVAAINAAGVGASSSAAGPLTPATAALAVQDLSAAPGDTVIDLAWTPIANGALGGGAFIRYEIHQRTSGGIWPGTPTFTSTSQALATWQAAGLANGTSYDFKIVVITSANAAEIAGNTATVAEYAATTPSAPRALGSTAESALAVILTWQRPVDDGGTVLTGYLVSITGGVSCGATSVDPTTGSGSCIVSGLAYGTAYTITVRAENARGVGDPVTASYTTGAAPPVPTPAPTPTPTGGGTTGSGGGGAAGSDGTGGGTSGGTGGGGSGPAVGDPPRPPGPVKVTPLPPKGGGSSGGSGGTGGSGGSGGGSSSKPGSGGSGGGSSSKPGSGGSGDSGGAGNGTSASDERIQATVSVTPNRANPNQSVVFAVIDANGAVVGRYPVRLGGGATQATRVMPKPAPGQRVVAYVTNATGVSANAPAGSNVLNMPTAMAPDRPTGSWRLFGDPMASPLLFAGGSARLTAEGMALLDGVARRVRARGDGRLFVTGFARQGGGTEQYLKVLSKRRAHAVAQYLSQRGVRQWIRYWGAGARTEAVGVPDDRQVQVTWSDKAIPKTMRSADWMQAGLDE